MRWLTLLGLALVLSAAAYGVVVLLEMRAATAPPTPRAFVQATWEVYRFGPGHRFHVGQLGLDCKACHSLAEQGRFDAPGPTPCASCHQERANIEHGFGALERKDGKVHGQGDAPLTDCMRCHGFGPDPEQKATDCLSCHARAQGDTPKVGIHAANACGDCHDVHNNRVTPMACDNCHQLSVSHGHKGKDVASQCLDCHHAHSAATTAVDRCADCHGAAGEVPVPKTATEPSGHTCIGCHRPHGFGKEQVAPCTSCHTSVHVLEGKGHASCTSCHEPHAVRKPLQRNVCTNCHQRVELHHTPAMGPQAACTSCHRPHPERAALTRTKSAGDCGNCHAQVGNEGRTAHAGALACVQCHAPHGFAQSSVQDTACSKCHADKLKLVKGHAGHGTCTSCHQNVPHGSDLSPSACTSCHRDVHTNKGHATCTSCHDAHTGKQAGKVCADCHRTESQAQIHPKSAKLVCTSCHEQHQGVLRAQVGDCSACHNKANLPGLHEVPRHQQQCTACHKPHQDALPGAREACLACHQDRVDHQPTAKRCEGCHLFESTKGARRSP